MPVAQKYVVAAQVPHEKQYFFHDPGMVRLGDGTLIIAAPQWQFIRFGGDQTIRIFRSEDYGITWEETVSFPGSDAAPFTIGDQLLMFVQDIGHSDFQIIASNDRGLTWTDPVTVLEAPVWNITTPMVVHTDAVYWAMDYDMMGQPCHGKVMVRFNRDKSPLDPSAWSMSNIVTQPDLPQQMTRYLYGAPEGESSWKGTSANWLEPNTVDVIGRIRVFTRCNIDRYASASTAAVLDYDKDSNCLSFTQFTSWPGGQCKFFIIDDRDSKKYWMLSNLVTNSQDLLGWGDRWRKSQHGPPGNERRWLFLHYSIDCLNWFPAGCVARWSDDIYKSFMYPSAVVDGEDLVVLSRTSKESGDQHNADLCTVHRVSNFRSLAMDLRQGAPD